MINANPVGYLFIFKAVGPARAFVANAKNFFEAVIDVIIFCDNKYRRHYSKRAIIKRRGVIERYKIQLVEKRIELSNILQSPASYSVESLNNIKKIQGEIKKLERKTGQVLPRYFIQQIKDLV